MFQTDGDVPKNLPELITTGRMGDPLRRVAKPHIMRTYVRSTALLPPVRC